MLHPNDRGRTTDRPAPRCFRHSVWIASCDGCRDFHVPRLRNKRATPPAVTADPRAGE